jgi:3-deoxy-manno-octulosonate cytidylyltransferase (CMP-KDO synthetase)
VRILAVIPARYESQRFPGKPLVVLGDRPMVQWVYEAAKQSPLFADVVVATDSEKIADCVRGFGGAVVMTRSDHLTGTDRVAEVAANYGQMDVVVNVQGDQPFVTVEALQALVTPYLQGESPEMTTLGCPIDLNLDHHNPNTVKVLCDRNHHALYFSRAPIPYLRNSATELPVFHHLGLYAFRQDFLANYTQLAPTPFEQCEGLEQLRVLEYGYAIRVCQIDKPALEINTPEDLEQAKLLIQQGSTPP